ncbi:MAG: HlyC/CorC family transporter [Deltaproteobacteria bacterium]|nr:HlyC/CorC family transporter [Deltaproteobacteria bacterium]
MVPLLLSALCVVVNAFMVAAEFAFAKVRPSSLEALARAGDLRAVRALDMTRRLDAYLSATQLGITLASLGLGWLGEPAIADFLEIPLSHLGLSVTAIHGIAYTVAFATISLLHIVLGELVPKSIAIQHPEVVARWTGRTLDLFFKFTWPAMWILNGLSNAVLKAMRLPPATHGDGKLSADEFRVIIQASFSEDDSDRKRDLLERVLRGTDRPIRAVMVPRVDMVVLSTDASPDECIALVREHGFSRYPLCEGGNPDQVVGYLHVKDLLSATSEDEVVLLDKKRDVLFVPDSARVGDLLSEFQVTNTPFAVVVDEYGGTDGLVTVEDVVEEMVGEIHDEHDAERLRIVGRPDGSVSVDASVVMGEIDVDDLGLDNHSKDETVGAYVVEKLRSRCTRRSRNDVRVGHRVGELCGKRRLTGRSARASGCAPGVIGAQAHGSTLGPCRPVPSEAKIQRKAGGTPVAKSERHAKSAPPLRPPEPRPPRAAAAYPPEHRGLLRPRHLPPAGCPGLSRRGHAGSMQRVPWRRAGQRLGQRLGRWGRHRHASGFRRRRR